jgi:hypothetical protein
MTLVHEDIAATRRAVVDLERRAASLVRHFGDTVDAKRLISDVGRLGADLDLLCGQVKAPKASGPPSPREVIPDKSYPDAFWMDAEDEGLGQHR